MGTVSFFRGQCLLSKLKDCVIFASLAMVRPVQGMNGFNVPAACAPLQAMLKAVSEAVPPHDLKSRLQAVPPQASAKCCDKPPVMLKCRALACSDHQMGMMRYHERHCSACSTAPPPAIGHGQHNSVLAPSQLELDMLRPSRRP